MLHGEDDAFLPLAKVSQRHRKGVEKLFIRCARSILATTSTNPARERCQRVDAGVWLEPAYELDLNDGETASCANRTSAMDSNTLRS